MVTMMFKLEGAGFGTWQWSMVWTLRRKCMPKRAEEKKKKKKKRVKWDVRAQTTTLRQHHNLLPVS